MPFSGFTPGGTNTPALRDDFTRANSSTPGSSWNEPLLSGEGGAKILSNQLWLETAAAGGVYWGSDEASADVAACVTIAAFQNVDGNVMQFYVRVPSSQLPLSGTDPAQDFFRIQAVRVSGNDELRAYQIIDGSATQLTPATGANSIGAEWAVGDKIGFTIRENAGATEIAAWRLASGGTWTNTATWSSSTAGRGTAAGRTGFEFFVDNATDAAIDDFCIDTYVPGAGGGAPAPTLRVTQSTLRW